jgi:hypothetical protein
MTSAASSTTHAKDVFTDVHTGLKYVRHEEYPDGRRHARMTRVRDAEDDGATMSMGDRVRRAAADEERRAFRAVHDILLRCDEFQRREDVGDKMTRAIEKIISRGGGFVAGAIVSRQNINAAHIWATKNELCSSSHTICCEKSGRIAYLYLDISTGSACASFDAKNNHEFAFVVDKATRSRVFVPAALVVFGVGTRVKIVLVHSLTDDRSTFRHVDESGADLGIDIELQTIEIGSV